MTIYLISCTVLMAGSAYMILASCYSDGVVGKISLGVLFLGALVPIWQAIEGNVEPIPRSAIFLVAGAAGFMVRHLARFWRYTHKIKSKS